MVNNGQIMAQQQRGFELKKPAIESWWVWISILEDALSHRLFIYGCAAASTKPAGWRSSPVEYPLPSGKKLIIRQATVSIELLTQFHMQLEQGIVEIKCFFDDEHCTSQILDQRITIQESLGHNSARVETFYTLPDLKVLFNDCIDTDLPIVLSTLEKEINQPFPSKYAPRLGNFEVIHLNEWLDHPQPFLIDLVRDKEGKPADKSNRHIEICRTQDFAKCEHMAHIVCKTSEDTVLNSLITLPVDQLRSDTIISPENIDELEVWLFDEHGKLIHHEYHRLLRAIVTTLNLQGRRINIRDKLSEKASQIDKQLEDRASSVMSHHSHQSMVSMLTTGIYADYENKISNIVAEIMPASNSDKWFTRSVRDEIDVINHIRSLLDAGSIKSAIVVDPFFGSDALKRFALRLESQDVSITIVSSWAKIDPETGKPWGKEVDPIDNLEKTLLAVGELINPRLQVINLQAGNDQAFHDRYLVLYKREGIPEVYLLSNSINKMAGNWPFCMSLLSPDVARQVRLYVEGLCSGKDISCSVNPTITFRWPSNGT